MIRSIHKLLVASTPAEYLSWVELLSSLGLRQGERWEGRHSRGSKWEAPSAGLEIGLGEGFPDCDLVLETDNLDATYELLRPRAERVLMEPAAQPWGARIFTIEASGGLRIAVFAYDQPPSWRNVLEGELRGEGKRFAIVVARFNSFITERLLAGALDALRLTGVAPEDIVIARVPGSFELAGAARQMATSGRYDAVICLGCLLRGETEHYEVLASEVARGLGQSAQETGVPHSFGVLTCDDLEQAIDRAGLKMGNKGAEAALAAVEMASLSPKLLGDDKTPPDEDPRAG